MVQQESSSPRRRPGTLRRTTTLDVLWPDGIDGMVRFEGIGRDVMTGQDGGLAVVEQISIAVDVDPIGREVVAVEAHGSDGAQSVVGARIGRGVREAMQAGMAAEVGRGAPAVQLLDDMTGAWIVGSYAVFLWGHGDTGVTLGSTTRRKMEGVCLGFAPGSSAVAADGGVNDRHMSAEVDDLVDPHDPDGWHDLPSRSGMSLRRARRLDVAVTDNDIMIDSMFQDSSTQPNGGRAGVHQYGVTAIVARDDLVLRQIAADPRILPYGECPMAMLGLPGLVGTTLVGLRDVVPTRLKGVQGCTHLNDAVRALSLMEGRAISMCSSPAH